MQTFTIWSNAWLPEPAAQLLRDGVAAHNLIAARDMSTQDAVAALREADIAFGQPGRSGRHGFAAPALGRTSPAQATHPTTATM
jgi:hypothetical protein